MGIWVKKKLKKGKKYPKFSDMWIIPLMSFQNNSQGHSRHEHFYNVIK